MLDGDTEFAPGLRLVVTAGHTPGHQVVAVSAPTGTLVLAGQIVETKAEMAEFVSTGELRDWSKDGSQTERLAGARKVLDLDPATVWFSHDHQPWEAGQ
jgi:glyoxylase-like metal-dependent hydrolase (beta-lactamase superfamily II)